MTIDERLERLTERHEALTQSVELMHRDYLPQIRSRAWQKQIIEWAGRRPRLDPLPKIPA